MAYRNFVVTHEGYTVEELLAELDCTEDGIERLVYVLPPNETNGTDIDSDNSDEEHDGNLNHLGRNLLLSECEVQTDCKFDEPVLYVHSPSSSVKTVNNHRSTDLTNTTCEPTTPYPQPSTSNFSVDLDRSTVNSSKVRNKRNYRNTSRLTKHHPASDSSDIENKLPKRRKIVKEKRLTKKQHAAKIKEEKIKQWKTSDPNFTLETTCEPMPCSDEAMECQTPFEFFSLFFNDEMLYQICEQSNLYASQKNVNLNLTCDELLVFFGGLLMSGYAKYPNKRMYWSRENDAPTLLSESMRCNRFEQILRFLHLNDNNKIDSDRPYKLRLYIESLNTAFAKHGGLDEHLSVDESMIPYYGKHYAKQFIRGKPIRFGFKNWALCSSSGYLISYSIYSGKDITRESKFGLGGDVVIELLEKAAISSNCGHKIYIDNFFTSVPLVKHLAENGICATGTLRADRSEYCPLKSPQELKNEVRGSYDFRTGDKIMLVRWHDNNVVTVATNHEHLRVGTATRWSRERKSKVQVQQPSVFAIYNKGMGGVDLLDQNIATYRTRMRQRKWWWPIFVYLFDASVSNAWVLNRKLLPSEDSISQLLTFRRRLALFILKKYGKPSAQGKTSPRPLPELVRDSSDHWPQENEKQRRCANCTGKAKFVCSKCKVGLHPKCFMDYHA